MTFAKSGWAREWTNSIEKAWRRLKAAGLTGSRSSPTSIHAAGRGQGGAGSGGATDGRQAIDKYREALAAGDPYRLVIMDLTVPGGMGGVPAVKALQRLDPA